MFLLWFYTLPIGVLLAVSLLASLGDWVDFPAALRLALMLLYFPGTFSQDRIELAGHQGRSPFFGWYIVSTIFWPGALAYHYDAAGTW